MGETAIGILYLVATPIGNLEDITLRALRILRQVSLVAAEDTRNTRKLLQHYEINVALTSFHAHSPQRRQQEILEALSQGDVALVTDAGMPVVSDPGADLVQAAVVAGHTIVPLPGPSAVITALAAAGLPADRFSFVGFLPRTQKERVNFWSQMSHHPWTMVAFEVPHRLVASLADTLQVLGDRPVVIARELTKLHEEIYYGTLSTALQHFSTGERRGEFTLVIAGAPPAAETVSRWSDAQVTAALLELAQSGNSGRDAVAEVTRQSGRPRREVYRCWARLAEDPDQGSGRIDNNEIRK
ncbi:MAG: 16S rRNA (cytidine(1402)-2'-O)-methyltransferase [Chloroflexi bacterium]|nr:16S rRNA (cytidine(1402)-2'-O)-methyltransferase [Chloroflexota bacterium]